MVQHQTKRVAVQHQMVQPGVLLHNPGCPMDPNRTEETTQLSPETRQPITIARCLDCAAHIVLTQAGDVFQTEDSLENEDPEYVKDAKKKRGQLG